MNAFTSSMVCAKPSMNDFLKQPINCKEGSFLKEPIKCKIYMYFD